jgi:hypothetical protein
MDYFLVINNRIIRGPIPLPAQWSDHTVVHQLSTLTTLELAALGWYPMVPSTIIPREPFETISEQIYTINGSQVDETITLNPLVLADVILEKVELIRGYADTWGEGTFTWNGYTWYGDPVARQNITGMTTAIANGVTIPAGFTWRDALGTSVPLTPVELVQMGAAMLNWVNTTYGVAVFHIGTVSVMTNIETVIAYDLTTGWPV